MNFKGMNSLQFPQHGLYRLRLSISCSYLTEEFTRMQKNVFSVTDKINVLPASVEKQLLIYAGVNLFYCHEVMTDFCIGSIPDVLSAANHFAEFFDDIPVVIPVEFIAVSPDIE